MEDVLIINTLGGLSVKFGDKIISDNFTRSHKVWKIFKYLITNRHKMVTTESLIEMLWPEGGPINPQKSLYTLISRLRKLFSNNGANHQYIIYQHDCYQWNTDAPFILDVIEFERVLALADCSDTEEEKISYLNQAIDIYKGDYLAESTFELWVSPMNNYYNRLYIRHVIELINIYTQSGMHDEVIQLCNKAISIDPFEELLHERLIFALYVNGDTADARQHYDRFVNKMTKEFGTQPSDEFRTSCQNLWRLGEEQLELSDIKSMLDGESTRNNAYFCSVGSFNQIYQLEKRADERVKFPIFLALITVLDEQDGGSDMKRIKSAMQVLRQSMMSTLRRGDIVSQYSKNQYLLMLSARVPKEVEAAMARVKGLFNSKYKEASCELDIHLSRIGDDGQLEKINEPPNRKPIFAQKEY